MKEYEIANGDKVEKYHVAILFNKGTSSDPEYIQLAKSTENTITMNAETEDLDFIVDKSPTTVLKRYKPSLANPLTLYKGSDDYEYFWPIFYNMPTGADSNDKYAAWKCDTTFVLESLDPVNSQLTMTTQINGTITKGKVTVTGGVPSFTANS